MKLEEFAKLLRDLYANGKGDYTVCIYDNITPFDKVEPHVCDNTKTVFIMRK